MKKILVVNLGTPDKADEASVRVFLNDFLSDPDVITLPSLLRYLLLKLLILPFRPKRVAKLYQKIWMPDGSPLFVYTKRISEKLQAYLNKQAPHQTEVNFAMRYSNPPLKTHLEQLKINKDDTLYVIPLYPQYAISTTGSIEKLIKATLKTDQFRFIPYFYDHPLYIDAVVQSIRNAWEIQGRPQKLLFSYHSLPLSVLEKGDPYYAHCKITTERIVEKLGLSSEAYEMVFQSKIGRQKWLTPACSDTLIQLAKSGTQHINVVCPGFMTDCLETLEEIAIQNRELFLSNGGKTYHYIPALNDSDSTLSLLAALSDERSSLEFDSLA